MISSASLVFTQGARTECRNHRGSNSTNMTYSNPQLATFSLRGRRIGELRDLAQRHLKMKEAEVNAADRTQLIADLSKAAASDKDLSRDLRKNSISLKPSFYLMRFSEDF